MKKGLKRNIKNFLFLACATLGLSISLSAQAGTNCTVNIKNAQGYDAKSLRPGQPFIAEIAWFHDFLFNIGFADVDSIAVYSQGEMVAIGHNVPQHATPEPGFEYFDVSSGELLIEDVAKVGSTRVRVFATIDKINGSPVTCSDSVPIQN